MAWLALVGVGGRWWARHPRSPPKRRQRALGKLTPIEYETIMEPAASLAA
ncbi:hypothetical protein ABMV15_07725 [Corynebacterium belfantii]